jgi:putative ABC transport system permease protein
MGRRRSLLPTVLALALVLAGCGDGDGDTGDDDAAGPTSTAPPVGSPTAPSTPPGSTGNAAGLLGPVGLVQAADGNVWAAWSASDVIAPLEGADARPGTPVEVGDTPLRMVTLGTSLWVTTIRVIALAVIALGLMTATLNRLRDFAVLKALGARTPRLARAVAMQVLLTVVLAAAVATTAALALAWLLPAAAPAVQISITATAVAQTTAAALLVGLVAALWPLRRIAALDAATAFREIR